MTLVIQGGDFVSLLSMSSPEMKKKKQKIPPTPQSKPTLSLSDDLLMSCVARISKLYYPTLSLVSKSFRSLLISPELYKARSLLDRTESCLYVCLESFSDCRWFTLCRKPDKTLTNSNKKSTGYVLATVPTLESPPALFSGLVAVGSEIYNIRSSSRVSILDCRCHKWHEAPSLPVELMTLSASVVDEKIYVAGIHGDSLKNSSKVLDTRKQVWEHVPPIPTSETTRGSLNLRSACIDGKFHETTDKGVAYYDSKEVRWDIAEAKMSYFWHSDSYCVIENVLYSVYNRMFRWYDSEVNTWRNLEGLVGLPKFLPGDSVRLADYGGKMAVLWDKNMLSNGEKMIWCAEIALERRSISEIWGNVEWVDHVLTVPIRYYIVKALAATV